MSDELRLPDELAACEARLAGQPLAASAINRDELLYRAGWAACEAQQGRETVAATLVSRTTDRATIAAWSAASAALAAALAVAVTLSLAPHSQPSNTVQQIADATPTPEPSNPRTTPRIVRGGFDVMSLVNRHVASASLWDNVERTRQPRPEEPILPPTEASLGIGLSPTATAASLLEELLPTSLRKAPAEPGDAPGTKSGDQAI